MTVPCVYQFHHLGKNNPSLSGDGFFMPIDFIQVLFSSLENLR